LTNDSLTTFFWNSTSLISHYNEWKINSYYNSQEQVIYELALRLANDLKSLEELSFSFNDTVSKTQNAKVCYGFNLKDLKLLSVSADKIVYGVIHTPLFDFCANLLFICTNWDLSTFGSYSYIEPDGIYQFMPYAFVIFSD
jgi:hypothetical protein